MRKKDTKDLEITTECYVSLNGQRSQLFIDPKLDLTTIRESFAHKPGCNDSVDNYIEILFLLLLLAPNLLRGQGFDIYGTITDVQRNAIEGAEVTIAGTSKIIKTDNQGYYRFQDIAPGKYQVHAFAIGKEIASQLVELKNKDVILNFQLTILLQNWNR